MPPHHPTTVYLSAPDMVRLVRRKGLSACIAGVAERIEREFLRWHDFDKSARLACHSAVGVIELMPIADAREYSFKYVNGHPKNTREGLPTVMAFGVALIGNGAQSEFQALAFRDGVGVRELRLFDTDPRASAKLASNLAGLGLELRLCASIAEAVRGADIVTTVTADKSNATILTPEMIEPGMHLNAVGGDCPGKTELHRRVLEAATVFVEYEPQTRIEGDIQQLPADFAVTEFWQVLAGTHPGRSHAAEVTVFDSVGFALEDYAALAFMRDTAAELGIGETIELVPHSPDPKDLFGILRDAPLRGATSAAAVADRGMRLRAAA